MNKFSQRLILLVFLVLLSLHARLMGQEIVGLVHQVDLFKVSHLQKGYLDIQLPTLSNPDVQILKIHYSTYPDDNFYHNGVQKVRWNASTLVRKKYLNITIVMIIGEEALRGMSNHGFVRSSGFKTIGDAERLAVPCQINESGSLVVQADSMHNIGILDTTEVKLYKSGFSDIITEYFTVKRKQQVRKSQFYLRRDTELISRIAASFYSMGRSSLTEYLFRHLIKMEPTNPAHHNFLAISLARKGQFDLAALQLRKALLLAKNSISKANVYYGLANYYALKNEKDKAIDYLRLADQTDGKFKLLDTIRDLDFINLKDYPPFLKLMKSK